MTPSKQERSVVLGARVRGPAGALHSNTLVLKDGKDGGDGEFPGEATLAVALPPDMPAQDAVTADANADEQPADVSIDAAIHGCVLP
jgi:hypothetical protein